MTMSDLPVGMHPRDRRGPDSPVIPPPSAIPAAPRGHRPWNRSNAEAMGVFQRAAATWRGVAYQVGTQAVQVVGRRSGRETVTIWVPPLVVVGGAVVTVTNGVLVAPTAGEAESYSGVVVSKGDPPLFLDTEAPVYVVALPDKSPGYCQVAEMMNPATPAPGS